MPRHYKLTSAPLARDRRVDAFFSDEWSLIPVSNPRGVHFSRFTDLLGEPMTKAVELSNPLDPWLAGGLAQPEQIPAPNQGQLDEFCIYIPPLLYTLAQAGSPAFPVKITLLFCPGYEYNRHGLRTFFVGLSDRILITVPGIEPGPATQNKAWGIGITVDMINQLLVAAGTPSITNWVVDTIAGYSTGYRGVNGTVNNGLLPIAGLKRLIFYDALYWGDAPPLPPGTPLPPTPPGVAVPPPTSARNTWRMLNTVSAGSSASIITYEATDAGTPRNSNMLRAPIPTGGLIDLKKHSDALKALVLARVLENGVKDGYFPMSAVPAPITRLIQSLPARGTLASSSMTAARAPSGQLADWASAHAADVTGAAANVQIGINLIVQHMLMGWDLGGGLVVGLLHDGFLQEFGWEFLID